MAAWARSAVPSTSKTAPTVALCRACFGVMPKHLNRRKLRLGKQLNEAAGPQVISDDVVGEPRHTARVEGRRARARHRPTAGDSADDITLALRRQIRRLRRDASPDAHAHQPR